MKNNKQHSLHINLPNIGFKLNSLTGTLLASISFACNGASFDCTKAKGYVESTVCQHEEISALDDLLSKNYKTLYSSNVSENEKLEIRKEQIAWVKHRNFCENNKCIYDSYKKRIDELCRKIEKPYEAQGCGISNKNTSEGKKSDFSNTSLVSQGEPQKHSIQITSKGFEFLGLRIGMSKVEAFAALNKSTLPTTSKPELNDRGYSAHYCKNDCGLKIFGLDVSQIILFFDANNKLAASSFATNLSLKEENEVFTVVKQKYGEPDYKKTRLWRKVVAANAGALSPIIEQAYLTNFQDEYYGLGRQVMKIWVNDSDGSLIVFLQPERKHPLSLTTNNVSKSGNLTQASNSFRFLLSSENFSEFYEGINDK